MFEPVLVSVEVEADQLPHRRGEALAQFRGFDNFGVGAERDQTDAARSTDLIGTVTLSQPSASGGVAVSAAA